MKTSQRLPALFVSHGSPMLALQDDAYTHALHDFCAKLPEKPKAIVVVSAHGLSEDGVVEINASEKPRLIYDFRGFPSALYQMEYPCPGAPELAARVASLVADAGFAATLNRAGGLDHGVWIPLRIAFPQADIPVLQVSMPHPSQPESVLKLGQALAPLRDEGVLLIGSGGIVHNLGKLVWHQKEGPAAPWAREYDAWVLDRLAHKDVTALCDFEASGPNARLAHPTTEHFFPLFFTVGASRFGDEFRLVHQEIQYSSFSMSCFALESQGGEATTQS